MKKHALIARKSRATIMVELLKFLAYFGVFTLLAMAKFEGGIAPFNLGLFVALIFCRENILKLAPFYVLALFIASPTAIGLLSAVLPPLTLGLAQAFHLLIKRPIKLAAINIYAFLSQVPLLALNIIQSGDLALALINLALSQVFTYCAIVICYAVLVRGLKYKFSADEVACGFLMLLAVCVGIFKINIVGFSPFFLLSGFVIVAAMYLFETRLALCICFVIGLGAGLDKSSLAISGAFLLYGLVASVFIKSNIYFAGASIILCDLIAGFYFKAFAPYDILHFIAVVVGVGLFLIIPKKWRNHLVGLIGTVKEGLATKNFVNRTRAEVYDKLKSAGGVFLEMQTVLQGENALTGIQNTKRALAQEMVLCICADCPKRQECFTSLASDTSVVFNKIIDAVAEKEKVTMLDVPTFLTSRCNKLNAILEKANEYCKKLHSSIAKKQELALGREIMGYQMAGVAHMLDALASDLQKAVSFDCEREARIIEELSYHNVVASEVLVYTNKDGEYEISLVIRKTDLNKKAIPSVISKLLRSHLIVSAQKEYRDLEFVTLTLVTKPRYAIIFGEATVKKSLSECSGDTRSIVKISGSKYLIALCDGMGSGKDAFKNSEATMSMIEGFYRADFGDEMTLNLTNRLLALKDEDDFSALDICVVDAKSGLCDLIKLGGVESFLVRGNNVDVLSSNALPLGILDEVKPHIERKCLNHGDMLIMISDGILEGLSTEEVVGFLKRNTTLNPQVLADNLLLKATGGGQRAADDTTVMVARLVLAS